MTDTYNDTTGSRKKFLIPLVVLLLCAVSLTGAGYAYNSSVQNDSDPFAPEYAALVFTNSGGTEMTSGNPAAATGATFVTATTINPTAKVVVDVDGTLYVKAYFKLISDKATADYTVSADLKIENSSHAETDSITIDAAGVDADHKTVSFAVGDLTVRNQADTADVEGNLVKDTVYIAVIPITVTCNVWFNNATASADAAAVDTAVSALHYNLKLTSASA